MPDRPAAVEVLPEALEVLPGPEPFRAWLSDRLRVAEPTGALALDLTSLEVEDGALCASLASELRAAASMVCLTLVAPPQVLAHTLYRVGATRGPRGIRIVDARDELGTSS